MWWEGSNRLFLLDIESKDETEVDSNCTSVLKIRADWFLPGDITCSHVHMTHDRIAFGLNNGKVLVWGASQGRSTTGC